MRAGKLRQRVQIQVKGEARDRVGQESETFNTIATVWAEVKAVSGDTVPRLDADQPEATHLVRIRHRAGITEQHRILWGARALDIQNVEPDEKRRELLLRCAERKSAPVREAA